MAVKRVRYERKFIGEKQGILLKSYKQDEEDYVFRKLLVEKFDLFCSPESDIIGSGFDGKIIYDFRITGYPKTEKEYTTTVFIRKLGDEIVIKNGLSDLELFLTSNKFDFVPQDE